jgi:hypothetical protein
MVACRNLLRQHMVSSRSRVLKRPRNYALLSRGPRGSTVFDPEVSDRRELAEVGTPATAITDRGHNHAKSVVTREKVTLSLLWDILQE